MRLVLISLAACNGKWTETQEDGLRHLAGSFDTDRSGDTEVRFEVLDGETSFAAVAQAYPLRTNLPRLSVRGDVIYQADTASDHLLTNAGFVSPVSVLSWPILDSNPPLSADDHELQVGTLAAADLEYESGGFDLDIWLKSDSDLERGTVNTRVVWNPGIVTPEGRTAFDEAFVVWEAIYAARGITVNRLADIEWAGEPIDRAGDGVDAWLAMSGQEPARVVNLVVVESIPAIPQAYGLAGGIPGPPGATAASGVLVAYDLAVGVDHAFSTPETRILGETLAHETGHYLGLFHPVEIGWEQWDSLADTDDCRSEADCEAAFADNLMFPYPVCDLRGVCTAQNALTPDQGALPNRHVLVD
jgi:hypothetical protein